MTILPQQICEKTRHQEQHSNHNHYHPIAIPKTLFSSHQSTIGLIPLQLSHQISGLNPFFPMLLTYLQVQHYNIHLSKILAKKSFSQTQHNLQEKDEQKSQDGISIGSSVNIRERKVSFGVVNYKVEERNKKRPKKVDNLWMIVNQTDQQKLEQVLQTEHQIISILKKLKLLAYQYAYQKDQLTPNSNPVHSLFVHKAFDLLFPKSQKQLTDLFLYQKGNLNSILQFFTSQKKQQLKPDIFSKSIKILLQALESAFINKILTLNKNQPIQDSKFTNDDYFIRNITQLMEYFGFSFGKEFKLISSADEYNFHTERQRYSNIKTDKQQNINLQLTGIEFQNGFFKTIFIKSGYLISINLSSLQNINQNIKKIFLKLFDSQKSRENHSQPSITQQKYSQGSVLTWQQTHFHFVTPTNFISRYNNRYFKNQRLIYKQKSKLESRFKEQELQDLIPADNYEGGYQILISSREKNNSKDEKKFSLKSPFNEESHTIQQSEHYINPDLEHSFSPKKNIQVTDFRESFKQQFFRLNGNKFYVEQEEEIVSTSQDYIAKENYELQSSPVRKRISREQQIDRLYKKEDFQISDNQILDDIERVLI